MRNLRQGGVNYLAINLPVGLWQERELFVLSEILRILCLPAVMATTCCGDRIIEYILINYRWVFVCFFLLPASLLYEIYNYGRNWIIVKLNSAPKLHDRKVKKVQRQVSKDNSQWIKYAIKTVDNVWSS